MVVLMEFEQLCRYMIIFFAGVLIGKSIFLEERVAVILFFGTFVLYFFGYFNGWTKKK